MKPIHFFSTVHPSPWAPSKGTFNRSLLQGIATTRALSAVVPVPWTERFRRARAEYESDSSSYPTLHPPFWFIPRLAPLMLAAGLGASTYLARKRAIERSGGGVILSYWTDPDGTVAVDWGRQTGSPVVHMVGGSDVLLLANGTARGRRMARTLARADRILAVGSDLAQRVADMGVDPERITVLARGVDRSTFSPGSREQARLALGLPPERTILLWVGRMVPVKGIDVLLRALQNSELTALNPLQLLVGEGPERSRLEREARDLVSDDRLRFVGSISSAELPTWYRAADLFVLPSLSEGIPNVLLESLACGVGFVASNVGSIPEVSPEPQHDLVPANDHEKLAARLVSRIREPRDVTVEIPDRAKGVATVLAAINRVS